MFNLFLLLLASFGMYLLFSSERYKEFLKGRGVTKWTTAPTFSLVYWGTVLFDFAILWSLFGLFPALLILAVFAVFKNSANARAKLRDLFNKILK